MVRIDKVRDERLCDVEDEGVKIRSAPECLLGRGCATGTVRMPRGTLLGDIEVQIEKVCHDGGQDETCCHPQRERRPEGCTEHDEEIGDLDRQSWSVQHFNRRDGRQVSEGDELVGKTVEFHENDKALNRADTAEVRPQFSGVPGDARRVPGLRDGLAYAGGLAVDRLSHHSWRWGQ